MGWEMVSSSKLIVFSVFSLSLSVQEFSSILLELKRVEKQLQGTLK